MRTNIANPGHGPVGVVLMCTIPATAATFYLPLARELRKSGYNVTFCSANGPEAEAIRREGFELKTISIRRKPFSLGNIAAILQLTVFLRKRNIEIIETSTPVASVVGRTAAVIAGVPIRINTVRGMFPRDTHKWQSLLFDLLEALLHHTTSYTLVINKKDREELLSKGFAKQGKIAVIGCGGVGVDLDRFDPALYSKERIIDLRKTLGIGEKDFIVAFIGRLSTEKGIMDYMEALSKLSEDTDDIKGLVVGEVLEDEHGAVDRKAIEDFLEEKGIRDRAILTGRRSDIPELIATSDVIVLPSKREGFGMVLAEAAAMGKPVVAYRSRGVEQAVVDGETGFIIEPGDVDSLVKAIQYLYADKSRAGEIGRAARSKAEKEFSQAYVVREFIDVFREAAPPV